MEVILKGIDGEEIVGTIQSLRSYPALLWWSGMEFPHRFFIRTGENTDNHYMETRPEPLLTLGGKKSG